MSSGRFDTVVFVDDLEIDATIEYDAAYRPAQISGTPEKCEPAEGELTILSCEPTLPLPDGITMHQFRESSRRQEARLEQACWDHFIVQRP